MILHHDVHVLKCIFVIFVISRILLVKLLCSTVYSLCVIHLIIVLL